MAQSPEDAERYCARIEKREGVGGAKWGLLYPILLPVSIPILGMALK